jgi:hypothetical protein
LTSEKLSKDFMLLNNITNIQQNLPPTSYELFI